MAARSWRYGGQELALRRPGAGATAARSWRYSGQELALRRPGADAIEERNLSAAADPLYVASDAPLPDITVM